MADDKKNIPDAGKVDEPAKVENTEPMKADPVAPKQPAPSKPETPAVEDAPKAAAPTARPASFFSKDMVKTSFRVKFICLRLVYHSLFQITSAVSYNCGVKMWTVFIQCTTCRMLTHVV